jgi:small subunit ribosomal protein S1
MESGSMVAPESVMEIKPKMKFSGKVAKTSLAGALIDIGPYPLPAVLHVSQIPTGETGDSVKRVEDILQPGQEIEVWVRRVRADHIELTMLKPLDLEWREIKTGMTVKGKVVRIEKFGAFVEIGAERPGLVHISEMTHGYVKTPNDLVKEDDEIEAIVLDVNRKKKQIKLSMKALEPEPVVEEVQKPVEMVRPPREKPALPPRKKSRKSRDRGEDSTDFLVNLTETGKAEAADEPTALGLAIMEAMDKARIRKKDKDEKVKKSKTSSHEQEDLISRTLEHQKNQSSS